MSRSTGALSDKRKIRRVYLWGRVRVWKRTLRYTVVGCSMIFLVEGLLRFFANFVYICYVFLINNAAKTKSELRLVSNTNCLRYIIHSTILRNRSTLLIFVHNPRWDEQSLPVCGNLQEEERDSCVTCKDGDQISIDNEYFRASRCEIITCASRSMATAEDFLLK